MLNINVTVRDVALNISRDLTLALDDRLLVRDLTALLVSKLAWPEKDITGQTVRYTLCLQQAGGQVELPLDAPVSAAGILNASVLIIGPVLTASPASQVIERQPAAAPTPAHDPAPQFTMKPLERR